jgi:hypothetical protein
MEDGKWGRLTIFHIASDLQINLASGILSCSL